MIVPAVVPVTVPTVVPAGSFVSESPVVSG